MENLSKYTNQSINQLIIGVHIKIEKNVQREREKILDDMIWSEEQKKNGCTHTNTHEKRFIKGEC